MTVKPSRAVKETVDHEAEAKRYDRLAKEAHNQTTSAQTPEYYKKKAAEHRSKIVKETRRPTPKTKMEESNMAVKGLAKLMESELEKAQVVIAAKSILDKLQKMAEDVAKIEADDIMPMLDSMRLTFGPELTDSFNDVTTGRLRQTTEAIKGAKEAITKEVGRLENNVNGEETNDMGMDDSLGGDDLGDELGGPDMGGDDLGGDLGGDDMSMGADAAPAAPEGGEEEIDGGPSDDLDAAFDSAAADTAAGRAKKESVQRNIKALSESADPDRLVFEVFRRTLKESKDAVRAARAVASAFAIDFQDVVGIVKEGKTFKDEKGKSNKNKDFTQARKDKKRDRPSDIDEGKTFKDEKGKSNKNKDFTQARKDKKRDRPSDIDEAKTFGAAHEKKPAPVFGKRKPEDKPKGPVSSEGGKVVNEFEMKPTPASKKGMFDGKTEAELKKELTAAKKGGPHAKGSPELKKIEELEFAIRAKSGWKKTDESKGFKTGAVAEGQRNAVASTRQITTEGKLFTPEHLAGLQKAYGGIERIDPSQPTYGKMIAMLDLMSPDQLKQIAGADIRFLSSLAGNRVNRSQVKEEGGMSLEDAKKIVGRTNGTEPFLSKMIKALSMHSWLNTPEENKRLEAAKMVKASMRKSAGSKKPVREDGAPEDTDMDEDASDLIKSREEALERAKKERAAKGFGAMERAKKPTAPVEESKKGVEVLVMKHHDGTTPKTKPFSKPAKFPRK